MQSKQHSVIAEGKEFFHWHWFQVEEDNAGR